MKHKIAIKPYSWECGDGCCSENGMEWFIDGKNVHESPSYDAGWIAVLNHFGIEAELVGLDENGEEIWSM
jgi:hypothetical protein